MGGVKQSGRRSLHFTPKPPRIETQRARKERARRSRDERIDRAQRLAKKLVPHPSQLRYASEYQWSRARNDPAYNPLNKVLEAIDDRWVAGADYADLFTVAYAIVDYVNVLYGHDSVAENLEVVLEKELEAGHREDKMTQALLIDGVVNAEKLLDAEITAQEQMAWLQAKRHHLRRLRHSDGDFPGVRRDVS